MNPRERWAARFAASLAYALFLLLGAMAIWGRELLPWLKSMG